MNAKLLKKTVLRTLFAAFLTFAVLWTPSTHNVSAEETHCSLRPVFFNFDEAVIRSDQRRILDENILCFQESGALALRVIGHTNMQGSAGYNRMLGEKLAQSVKKALQRRGISKEKIFVISRGESEPQYPHPKDARDRAENRRVTFELIWEQE